MAAHNDLGKKGEDITAKYLLKNKYEILERNWRYLKAEIDIIALKENTLVIIEVKTRSSLNVILPEESVNQKKIKLLISAANEYVNVKKLNVEVQFDIVTILKKNQKQVINHIKNAFLHF